MLTYDWIIMGLVALSMALAAYLGVGAVSTALLAIRRIRIFRGIDVADADL